MGIDVLPVFGSRDVVDLVHTVKPTEAEVVTCRRDNMARFKAPRRIVFGPLPKTSTGKVQKFVLRERARDLE